MKKKNQYKMKTKHLITMMTILCLGLIVLSLSTSFSFAPVRIPEYEKAVCGE